MQAQEPEDDKKPKHNVIKESLAYMLASFVQFAEKFGNNSTGNQTSYEKQLAGYNKLTEGALIIQGTLEMTKPSSSTSSKPNNNLGVADEATTLSIKTPYGFATQSTTAEALSARGQVQAGGQLFRMGSLGVSEAGESQFWSLENPLSISPQSYARKYGIPLKNIESANFVEAGTIKPNSNFVTRQSPSAPGSVSKSGGAIEVVTQPNSVFLDYFSTFKR
jgi:hypothetical protein